MDATPRLACASRHSGFMGGHAASSERRVQSSVMETLALWAGRHSLWVGVVVTVVAVILAVRTWREVASVSSSS